MSCKTHEVTTMHYVPAGLSNACRNTAAPEAPKEPALNGPAQQLESLLKSLREVNARLLQVADRFTGSIPRPESVDVKPCAPTGIVGRYQQIADDYANEIRQLHETLQRLENV